MEKSIKSSFTLHKKKFAIQLNFKLQIFFTISFISVDLYFIQLFAATFFSYKIAAFCTLSFFPI